MGSAQYASWRKLKIDLSSRHLVKDIVGASLSGDDPTRYKGKTI
jgi:hypothetical protein